MHTMYCVFYDSDAGDVLYLVCMVLAHAKQHHIFDIERWCFCDMQRRGFAFPAWLLYGSCHYNESRLCGFVKASLFGKTLPIEHKFIVDGML